MKAPTGPEVRAMRKDDAQDVAALAYPEDLVLVIDPGARGMALLFDPLNRWSSRLIPRAVYPFWGFAGFNGLSDVFTAYREEAIEARLTVVMEESFGGGRLNVQSDLASARYAGAAIGALAYAFGNVAGLVNVVMVRPQVWITAFGVVGNKVKREQRKKIARDYAVAQLGQAYVDGVASLAPHREAFCDAYAITRWWGQFASRAIAARGRS